MGRITLSKPTTSWHAGVRAAEAWQAYLAACLAATLVFFLLPAAGLAQGLLFTAVHLSALVAIVAGVRIHRPDRALIWYLIAVGQALYAAANVIWYIGPLGFGVTLPYPSPVDGLYLISSAVLLAGLSLLIRVRSGGHDRAGLIDAVIVATGVGMLSWVFLMAPYVRDPALSLETRLVSAAYPLVDVLLLGILARLTFATGGRATASRLIMLGLPGLMLGDSLYAVDSLRGAFSYGKWYFAGWLLFYALLGAAALHPSMRELSRRALDTEPVLSRWRLAFLAAAALVPPAILAFPRVGRGETTVLACVSGVMFLLVMGRMSGLMVDITERRRTERMKDEFLSVVSHELRTPLTSIHGALGLLAGGALGPMPDKGRRMVEIAVSNTDRLIRLINDILDIERIHSGRVSLNRTVCNAGNLMSQATESMRPMAGEAGVELATVPYPAPLLADPDRILQTLTNLLSNAVKFSPSGASVSLTARGDGEDIVFRVTDHGRGIPPAQLEAIFGRFQQVDAMDSRDKGGTGLGLAICRAIATQHGGRIWAESSPGQGSTFSFTLPVLDTIREEPPVEPAAPPGNAPKVLVCDDDPSVREVLGALLTQHGYRVLSAATGQEAVAVANTAQPTAIVLDLLMPGMSGWEVAAALKRRPSTADIPIVLLSVLSRGEATPPPADVAAWVDKPLQEEALLRALDRVVARREEPPDVVVVEDDQDLADLLTDMFARHGLRARHAASGREAVALCHETLPDLLVLDLGLPDGDGFGVVDELRRGPYFRRVPLVVYTARDLDESDRHRLRLGETVFFTKGRTPPEQFERQVIGMLDRLVPDAAPV